MVTFSSRGKCDGCRAGFRMEEGKKMPVSRPACSGGAVCQRASPRQTVKNLKLTKATAMKEATMPLTQSTAGRMAGQRWVSNTMASRVG